MSTLLKIETGQEVSSMGFVSLVGAGPGDPDLLTVKGMRVIQNAEVLVYDRLVSQAILDLAAVDAEMIYVGKKLDFHYVPQDKINQLLVDKALEGKRVVRLKGGDPFIFGRGGEEVEALADANVAFEVIPGITSAIGCTAYAGIPLTHRDYAQSVQFITGHLKKEGNDVNWASLASPNQTLVFYMGLKQSPIIVQNLLSIGLDPETPTAIIERGTTAAQRVIVSPLKQLAESAAFAESPALIIVGRVVELHNKLNWYN
jgi:uroporphyrin-III C-methyltransferase